MPVPNANTRVEGSLSGQFHYADLLPVEAFGRLEKAAAKVVPILTPSFGFPYLVFNTKEGSMASSRCARRCRRRSATADMLARRLRRHAFFIVEGNHYPKGTPFYSTAGTEHYNKGDAKKAKAQVEQAGYKGEPVRILTSRQYDFHYNMALIMAEQLKRAGFKAELQRGRVGDAAAAPRRPEAVGHLHHALGPVPRADAVAAAARRRRAGLVELAGQARGAGGAQPGAQPGQARRRCGPRCSRSSTTKCPTSRSASFASLSARSPKLEGYTPMPCPFFWNTGLKN